MLCFFFYVDLWNLQPQVFVTTDPEWGLMDPIKPGALHRGANKQRESKTDSVSQQALWFTSRYCAAFYEHSEVGISTLQVGSSPKSDCHEVWFRISSCSIFPSVVNKTQKNSSTWGSASLYFVWSLFFIIILSEIWACVTTSCIQVCELGSWCWRAPSDHVCGVRLFLLYLKRTERDDNCRDLHVNTWSFLLSALLYWHLTTVSLTLSPFLSLTHTHRPTRTPSAWSC